MSKLDELRAALEATTPGEWNLSRKRHTPPLWQSTPQFGVHVSDASDDLATVRRAADAEFIALARNNAAALLGLADALATIHSIGHSIIDEWDAVERVIPEIISAAAAALETLK